MGPSNLICVFVVLMCFAQSGTAIECYKCNSAYDPRCGDPFDPYSLGKVHCQMLKKPGHLENTNLTATLCRKITQKVYGKTRVMRDCGYVTDDRDDKDCLKRSGTHDVQALYCACTTDLCNSAPGRRVAPQTACGAVLFALVTARARHLL